MRGAEDALLTSSLTRLVGETLIAVEAENRQTLYSYMRLRHRSLK